MSRTPAKRRPPTIVEAATDPNIWGAWFKDTASWSAWFAFLKATFGLPLDDAELAVFQKHTGRASPSLAGYFDATSICGRRAGKSLSLALLSAYLAAFRDWSEHLVGGERGIVMVVAADRRQA